VAAPAPPAIAVPPTVISMDIEDALRASADAVRDLDVDGITRAALQGMDYGPMRDQMDQAREDAREAARQARENARQQQDDIHEQVDRMKQQLQQQQQQFAFRDMAQDFTFQTRGRGLGGDENGLYNSGLSLLTRHQYDQAIARFDQVIALKGARVDASLYWKAFAQYHLGKTDEALATIADLRKGYAQSAYLSDVRVLEADVRKSSGKPAADEASDDEIKLLAINSLQSSNPEGALPLLEGVLKATNSPAVKRRALFVLAQNDQPAAHQMLLSYAKGAGNPDLQVDAIRYLTARRQPTTTNELDTIYNSTQDLDVRRAVLDALISARDRESLVRIAGGDSPAEIRRIAINSLGNDNLMPPQELFQLYQKEENKDLRVTMVRAMASMGATDQLVQVARSDKDPSVRVQAVRSLGNLKPQQSGQTLVNLYESNQDKDTRNAVIGALSSQGNADSLIALARKETSTDLKLQIVRRISDLAPRNKAAMDYLMELVK
jgi:HEAT repeat protein